MIQPKKPPLLRTIFSARMLAVLVLGFSSGLPLPLVGSTLKAWMEGVGVDLTIIGIFSLVGLPYALKFLWSPLMDRFVPPLLGRRRGWILICQFCLILAIAFLGTRDPAGSPGSLALVALLVAFLSASQDIAIDAYRRDLLQDEELGLGSALAVNGYRVGMLVAGSLALQRADSIPWREVYLLMAASLGVGVVATFLAPDPVRQARPPASIREAIVNPFLDYFRRQGALLILVFILLFKIGDSMASEISTPFYLNIGFTKTAVGMVAKMFGLGSMMVGGVLGGVIMIRLGINRSLWVFGILQAVSISGLSVLAHVGASIPLLAAVVSFECLTSGMGTAAYVAFMASLCNLRYTATQYALLSSLMGVPRVLLGASSGYLAKHLGWEAYFVFCTLLAVPGLLLLMRVAPWRQKPPAT